MRRAFPLLFFLAACSHGAPRPRVESDVRCILLRLATRSDLYPNAGIPAAAGGEWVARFQVVNGGLTPIVYPGYGRDSPTYDAEVLRDGTWQPLRGCGWCGTGLHPESLAAGGAAEFDVPVPADGDTYRFHFGEPPVVTPPVSAPR